MTTEATIEQATIDWLTDLGYKHQLGTALPQNHNTEVVLKDRLLQFIQQHYPDIPKEIQTLAVSEFTNNAGADLEHRNRTFHLKLTKGIEFAYEDASGKEKAVHIYPIDFTNPENNTFWAVRYYYLH